MPLWTTRYRLPPPTCPRRIAHGGRYASDLEPLDAAGHAGALRDAVGGPEHDGSGAISSTAPIRPARVRRRSGAQAGIREPLYSYAILNRDSGHPEGYASTLRIEPAHRVVEVGSILVHAATPAHPRGDRSDVPDGPARLRGLGYRRYEWKCDRRNEPSRRAALRLGFTFEGIFRQHMIVKGRNRDTAWYSMLDCEWPARKAAFERWLDPANFDSAGQQRTPLSTVATITGA